MDVFEFLTTSLGAAVILGAFSLLFYKDNPWSRWTEYSIVGLGVGWGTVIATWTAVELCIKPLIAGDISKLVPLILGLLTYTQFSRRYRWAMRFPLALVSSAGLAIVLTGLPVSDFIVQLRAIAIPLTACSGFDLVNGIITIICVISVLSYFTFTHEHTGALGSFAKLGRIFMMLGFGAEFAMTVVSNCAHAIIVIVFLLKNWLHLL